MLRRRRGVQVSDDVRGQGRDVLVLGQAGFLQGGHVDVVLAHQGQHVQGVGEWGQGVDVPHEQAEGRGVGRRGRGECQRVGLLLHALQQAGRQRTQESSSRAREAASTSSGGRHLGGDGEEQGVAQPALPGRLRGGGGRPGELEHLAADVGTERVVRDGGGAQQRSAQRWHGGGEGGGGGTDSLGRGLAGRDGRRSGGTEQAAERGVGQQAMDGDEGLAGGVQGQLEAAQGGVSGGRRKGGSGNSGGPERGGMGLTSNGEVARQARSKHRHKSGRPREDRQRRRSVRAASMCGRQRE